MNSITNSIELGSIRIEGRDIPFTPISKAIFVTESDYDFRPVTGAELYGILRRSNVSEVVVAQSWDVNLLQVCYNGWRFGGGRDLAHYKMSSSDMDLFLHYYCNMPRPQKIDWKEHGF